MSPSKVIRSRVKTLTDLPNIGKSIAQDLVMLGITQPAHLTGKDPYAMYDRICRKTGVVHDACLLDTFISVTRFMDGEPPQPWWHYTPERKRRLAAGRGYR